MWSALSRERGPLHFHIHEWLPPSPRLRSSSHGALPCVRLHSTACALVTIANAIGELLRKICLDSKAEPRYICEKRASGSILNLSPHLLPIPRTVSPALQE